MTGGEAWRRRERISVEHRRWAVAAACGRLEAKTGDEDASHTGDGQSTQPLDNLRQRRQARRSENGSENGSNTGDSQSAQPENDLR